jgi:hypothetical protein
MQAASQHRRGYVSRIPITAIRNPAALAVLLLGLTASPSRADCGPLPAEVDARCYANNLQAAVDEALSSDRPLLLPRGTYRITRPLVIDYATHAGTGFEVISRGATIDGTSIADAPVMKILCSGGSPVAPRGCFYFHQEGTLFVNARSSGYAVAIGKPDFSDAHNSIKIAHLIVNNSGNGAEAGGVQLNYVLNAEMFIVGVAAGGGNGIALEQVQFSVLHGAGSATRGYALAIENGYTFSNTLTSMDLEESHTCLRLTSAYAHSNSFLAPYVNCPVVVEATHQGLGAIAGPPATVGSAAVTEVTWLD